MGVILKADKETTLCGRSLFFGTGLRVLLLIEEDPGVRMRHMAARLGVVERNIQVTVRDLVKGGFLERHAVGRRNSYTINMDRPMYVKEDTYLTVREVLMLFKQVRRLA